MSIVVYCTNFRNKSEIHIAQGKQRESRKGVNMKIINDGKLNLFLLEEALKKPTVYTKSTAKFWDDEYIASQMIQFHLNPEVEAASRTPVVIKKETDFIIKSTLMKDKDVLDLGCGPGLYVNGFAKKAKCVLGIDLSQNSISYAKNTIAHENSNVDFITMNYLTMELHQKFDIITLIYYDFGALDFSDQRRLLRNVHEVLRPNGYFVFDVLSDQADHEESSSIRFYQKGFWSPDPYMEIHLKMEYKDPMVRGSQYTLLNEQAELRIMRIYDQLYSKEEITQLLTESGFEVIGCYADLSGKIWTKDSKTMGIIAQKI
jgi:SAM-dependent methyltransferase